MSEPGLLDRVAYSAFCPRRPLPNMQFDRHSVFRASKLCRWAGFGLGPGASMRWGARTLRHGCLPQRSPWRPASHWLSLQNPIRTKTAKLTAKFWRLSPTDALPTAQEQARFLLFSTTDLWRQGGFAHGGVLWAPAGLDREGPVLKLMFGGGIYHYVSGALGNADVRGESLRPPRLPGWRFVRNGFTVTVFLGYDFQRHRSDARRFVRGAARKLFRRAYRLRTLVSADRHDDDRRRRIVLNRRTELQRAARHGAARFRRLLCRPRGPGLRRRRQLPSVPRRPSSSPVCEPANSSGRRAPAGPPTPTTAAAPTASSACSRGANPACGGTASPQSSWRPASGRPAPACRNADRQASRL